MRRKEFHKIQNNLISKLRKTLLVHDETDIYVYTKTIDDQSLTGLTFLVDTLDDYSIKFTVQFKTGTSIDCNSALVFKNSIFILISKDEQMNELTCYINLLLEENDRSDVMHINFSDIRTCYKVVKLWYTRTLGCPHLKSYLIL